MNTIPTSYVDEVGARLAEDHFGLRRRVRVGEFVLDLAALTEPLDIPPKGRLISGGRGVDMALGKEPYVLACSIMTDRSNSAESVQKYSQRVYEYFFEESSASSFGENLSRIVFPVVVSRRYEEEVKSFAMTYSPRHFSLPVWHIEHPVLVELDSGQIYHYDKVTFMGYRLKRIAAEAARRYFSLAGLG